MNYRTENKLDLMRKINLKRTSRRITYSIAFKREKKECPKKQKQSC